MCIHKIYMNQVILKCDLSYIPNLLFHLEFYSSKINVHFLVWIIFDKQLFTYSMKWTLILSPITRFECLFETVYNIRVLLSQFLTNFLRKFGTTIPFNNRLDIFVGQNNQFYLISSYVFWAPRKKWRISNSTIVEENTKSRIFTNPDFYIIWFNGYLLIKLCFNWIQ